MGKFKKVELTRPLTFWNSVLLALPLFGGAEPRTRSSGGSPPVISVS